MAGGPQLPPAREDPRFHEGRLSDSDFEQSGGPPTPSEAQQTVLRASAEEPPARSGTELAN